MSLRPGGKQKALPDYISWESCQKSGKFSTGINVTGFYMDRVAFMEEVWTVVQCYGTQSMLKACLNRLLMREILDKLDECEGKISELLTDSASDESDTNSPINMTHQENKEKNYTCQELEKKQFDRKW